MKKLLYFEQRKIWTNVTILSVIIMILFTVIYSISFLGFERSIVKNNGDMVHGLKIYKTMKNESEDITGVMNQKYLDKLIKNYNSSMDKKYLNSKSDMLTKYVFPNYFINQIDYGNKFNDGKIDINSDIVKSEELFYKKYKEEVKNKIKESNESIGLFKYTENQLKLIEEKIENINIPAKVGYVFGLIWFFAFYNNSYIIMLMIIGISLSSSFSKNGKNSIGELELSSKFSRDKGMDVRLISGNIFIIIVNVLFILTILIQNAFIFSLSGFNTSIQISWFGCIYNISLGVGLIILCLFGLLGSLIVGNLVMLISIKLKNNIISTAISLFLIFTLNGLTKTMNAWVLMFNPIYFSKHFSSLSGDYSLYTFIGNIAIPYWALVIFLSIIYILIIYTLIRREYKKYRCT